MFFTFALMFEFDAALVSRPRTFSSFVADHQLMYDKHAAKFVSKPTFLQAWWRWNSLVDFDFDAAFSCDECDKLPASERCFVMDGTHLGIKSSALKLADPPPRSDTKFACLETSVRVFVDDKALRDLLLGFSERELSSAELKLLADKCDQLAPWLSSCVTLLRQRECSRAPTLLRRLLCAISRATPVSGFILRPASTLPALRALAQGDNVRASPSLWSLLIDNCPCLASLLSDADLDAEIASTLRPIFTHFVDKCEQLTSGDDSLCFPKFLSACVRVAGLPAQFQHIGDRQPVSVADGTPSCHVLTLRCNN